MHIRGRVREAFWSAVNDGSDDWTWTVLDRFTLTGRGVVVIGEHVGAWPTVGQSVLIHDRGNATAAVVGGLTRFQHRSDGKFTGHSWGLLLQDAVLDDVPVGAAIKPS
jgi:hypothetical protein